MIYPWCLKAYFKHEAGYGQVMAGKIRTIEWPGKTEVITGGRVGEESHAIYAAAAVETLHFVAQ